MDPRDWLTALRWNDRVAARKLGVSTEAINLFRHYRGNLNGEVLGKLRKEYDEWQKRGPVPKWT